MPMKVEILFQIERRADQTQMRESLREIAKRFAGRPHLFGIQPKMIGITQHLFKNQPGIV